MVHSAEKDHKAHQEELDKQGPTIRGSPESSHGAHLYPRVGEAGEEHYGQRQACERGKTPGQVGQQYASLVCAPAHWWQYHTGERQEPTTPEPTGK